MRKIVYISVLFVIVAGCSVSRKHKSNTKETVVPASELLYESIVNQNITSRSFFVERAEFKVTTKGGDKSGIGTIKFLMPDKFLISIKSNTGIEIARIYIAGDSLMINDRMDKKLFYGSTSFLKRKYGFTTSILPVVFGDYVNDSLYQKERMKCVDGKLNIDGIVKDLRINYQIDCTYGKSILTIPESDFDENGIKISYDGFFKADNIFIPEKIEISDGIRNTVIEIKIEKLIIPWEGTIEFIPGKQYEKIHLQ